MAARPALAAAFFAGAFFFAAAFFAGAFAVAAAFFAGAFFFAALVAGAFFAPAARRGRDDGSTFCETCHGNATSGLAADAKEAELRRVAAGDSRLVEDS